MSRNIVKNISKSLACNYSQGISDHAKKSATDAPRTALKIGIQKIAEAVGDLIGNGIADKITSLKKFTTE